MAPLGLIQAALPLLLESPRPRLINITSDAGVEAYEGWGGYGAGKAALEHLGAVLAVEYPSAHRLVGRPRRPAHRDAPGRLPGRGHLGPARAGHRRARPSSTLIDSDRPSGRYRASRPRSASRSAGMTARWPLSRRRAAARARTRCRSRCRPSSRRRRRPRRAGMTRDAVRMLVADQVRRLAGAHPLLRAAPLPRRGRPRRHQHLGHLGRRGRRHDADGAARAGPPLDPAARRAVDRRGPPRRPGRSSDAAAGRDDRPAPAAAASPCSTPYSPGPGGVGVRLWVSPARDPGAAAHLPGPPRPADPLRLRAGQLPDHRPTRTSTPPSRARPRCRAPAGPSPPRS